jgi:hypothetical protein
MMKNLALRFLGVAMLGAASALVCTGESPVGKSVADSVAMSIRGGGCNNTFETDNDKPVYCGGTGCNKQKPNKEINGQGTAGSQSESCAGAVPGFGCQTFNKAAECARPTTDVSTGFIED